MSTPFIIYGLPRSRTAWLSVFLSYGGWICGHEMTMYMRSIEQVKSMFARPNMGVSETAAIFGRPLIRYLAPNIKEVVVLRPVEEVIDSVMKIDLTGVGQYQPEMVRRIAKYGYRLLQKAAKDPNVLVVNYHDLDKEETCAKIFEHCLPYKFDKKWWESLKDENIQIDSRELLRYRLSNRPQIDNFKKLCKKELLRLCRMGKIPMKKVA